MSVAIQLLVALLFTVGLAAPAYASGEDEDHGEVEDHGEIVQLSDEEIEEFGIEVAHAGPTPIQVTLSVPAEVQPNADRLAHIVPRYSGIVTRVDAAVGDEVRERQTLAVVESDESLAEFDVVTLIPGTVIEKHIALGEAVGREQPAFVIADLSTVWVDITVYQRDIGRIRVGQHVSILVGHESRGEGTISYVTPVISEETRTATARVVLENADGKWQPGMFVTAQVVVADFVAPVTVALTGLHTFEGRTVVFLETEDGFVPQPVTTGRADSNHAEVLSGLSAEDRYVSVGGFTLKAELGKSSLDEGHAH